MVKDDFNSNHEGRGRFMGLNVIVMDNEGIPINPFTVVLNRRTSTVAPLWLQKMGGNHGESVKRTKTMGMIITNLSFKGILIINIINTIMIF